MPESVVLTKAELQEIDANFDKMINPEACTVVQFNPETLKVSFANQIVPPKSGKTENGSQPAAGNQTGSQAIQFVGAGTTKLSLQLWFDITALPQNQGQVTDVRKLTQKVAYFITPKENKTDGSFKPPAVRFLWGSFQFDGIMDSMEESLEFFSNSGVPLRASVSINLSQQKITEFVFAPTQNTPSSSRTPGTGPLTQAPTGATIQGLADAQGKGDNWQKIAAANNIENPRQLSPGQLINMNIK